MTAGSPEQHQKDPSPDVDKSLEASEEQEDAFEDFIMESTETRYWPDHLLEKYHTS